MSDWKIIAAQLDLARQPEAISFLEDFIDLLAANHYNTLLLYLEDRIRTPSYPWPAPEECYTPEQMHALVRYAAVRNIDIIPCVSLLGHAERFLRHPELADLAELRGGKTGRFGHHTNMDFCPLNEKVYAFLEKYLTEVTAIFPGPYFHMGMDEVEQIGYCERCQPAAATFAGEQQLFLTAVLRGGEILRKLGKRPMLWADMFDNYPDLLPRIPRDMIMVDWQYQRDAGRSMAHFMNLKISDNLARYEELGFDYLIAPNIPVPNIRSFTGYALQRRPMGALLTSWEKTLKFQDCSLANFVYAGHLWHGEPHQQAVSAAVREIFACPDPAFNAAAALMLESSAVLPADNLSIPQSKEFFGRNPQKEAICRMLTAALPLAEQQVGGKWGRRVLQNSLAALRCRQLQFRLERLFDAAEQTGWQPGLNPELYAILQELEEFRSERCQAWQMARPGVLPCNFATALEKAAQSIRDTAARLENSARLLVRFCLPNAYGAETTCIRAIIDGRELEIAKGCFKQPDPSGEAFYEKTFLAPDGELSALSFACNGFAGQGLAYAEYCRRDGTRFVPDTIQTSNGQVHQPENILENSATFTYLGEQNMLGAYLDRSRAASVHSLVLAMKKASPKPNRPG